MEESRFTGIQIVPLAHDSEGRTVFEMARKHRVNRPMVYVWHRRFGGMDKSLSTDCKRPDQESTRLEKLLPERDPEIEVMKEIDSNIW